MIKFTIPGECHGKDRPRFSKVGGFVKTYSDSKTINYENWVKLCFQEAKQSLLEGQLKVMITCYFGIPKSYSKKLKEKAMNGIVRPTKKPDADNIAKSILDALNGMAYKDDSQVVELTILKYFDETPRVEVKIMGVNNDNC